MASSSDVIRRKFDVFLSFRGQDSFATFVSHLYSALKRKGIITFVDDYELQRGDGIASSLLNAIEESKFAVIIFSENYASSQWCLDELVYMLKCRETRGQIVVPIFYGIDPSDVRRQRGRYEEAFARHERRFRIEKVAQWRDALSTAASLSGFVSNDIGSESKLVDIVVEHIADILTTLASYLTGLVGIESRVQKIESLLCIDAYDVSFRTIGIWGMGGIGKTTLANVVHDRLHNEFEACCFLANVREESMGGGQDYLRNKVLRSLLNENSPIETPTISRWVKLSHMKVLLVFDDVSESRQLQFLKEVQFGPGSRIIVTSRDRQILEELQILWIYEVEVLSCDEAHQLLDNVNGFSRKHHIEDRDYIEKLVKYTGGLPLILKILGSVSNEELERLMKPRDTMREVLEVLRISYDGLDENEKEVFLDIACFYIGEHIYPVKRMLNACGLFADSGIKVLIERSLIIIEDDCLRMHDLLQQMGLEIVREECFEKPGRRSRLWSSVEVYDVLTKGTGTATVQSILLDMSNIGEINLSPRAFTKMHNLRYLKLCNFLLEECNVRIDDLEYLPDALRYLYWPKYPLKSLPSVFSSSNLVELHMPNSKLQRLWNRGQNPGQLKLIDLSYSKELVEVPNLSKCLNIQSINLQGCTDLVEVPSYFQSLCNLKSLNLRNCSRLKVLSELPLNMEFLDLGWTAIEGLPSSVWSLQKLVNVNLNSCHCIKNLPSSTWNLNSLTSLDLAGTSIDVLPSSIQCLSGVVSIKLKDCGSLLSLPTAICKLKSIQKLSLSRCYKFEHFPEILERMELLEILRLSHTAIKGLPSSIENLVALRRLELSGCRSLEFIPQSIYSLNLLEKVKLDGCGKLKELPFVRNSSILSGWQHG